jgi:glycosyltransferase involved in cell wall biosynthesis
VGLAFVKDAIRPNASATPDAAGRQEDIASGARPYRVLKVAPTSFFADYGCHVRIYEEAVALQRQGNTVLICTYPAGRDLEGVKITRSLGLPGGRQIRVGSSRHKLYLDAFLSLRTIREGLTYKPDVVHAHLHEGALIGYLVSRVSRCPLIFDFQGSLTAEMIDHNFLSRASRAYGPLRWLERTINDLADAIITSSRAAADLLIRDFGCSSTKIFPVVDGVDTAVFRPVWEFSDQDRYRIRSALAIPPGRKVVAYLGLLAEYQGSSHLLAAAAKVLAQRSDVHFLLMGYPGEARYRAFAEQLGISAWVTFTGRVAYERAPRYLVAGDVAVAPKISATEANGKLLNYMAVGLPTVAFDTAVNRDVLGPAGVFAPVGDSDALAQKLLDLLADEAEAGDRARTLRRRVEEKFSWEVAARQILDVYQLLTRA